MDRHRGDLYDSPDSHPYRNPRARSRSSDDPANHHRRSPNNYNRTGFSAAPARGRDNHSFDSPSRYPPSGVDGGGFRSSRPAAGFNSEYQVPITGHKRGFPFSGGPGGSPDRFDGSGFAKLFVGSVPRTCTEEDIRPLFEEHGNVVEVALIRDKRTGIQQGCCFIKYASSEEAERAIRSLHNHHTLPGGMGPIQVRYADGERERVVEYKLFVGSLNKQATEKEVEEIFSPYGRVEDVYLMRDEMKQSRGCGFVKYAQRDMAMAAINSLNGIFVMRGCEQALSVRFADPKRPRAGEPRGGVGGTTFGVPVSGPRFQSPGAGSTPNYGEPMHGNMPSNAWQPMSPHKVGPTSNADMQAFGNQMRPPRSNDMSSAMVGPYGGPTGSADGSLAKPVIPSSMPQQNYNQSSQQGLTPLVGQQIPPIMKPTQSPQQFPSMQIQQQSQSQSQTTNPSSYNSQPQTQTQTQSSGGQNGQAQVPNTGAGQMPYGQMYLSQQMVGLSGQVSGPQQTAPYVNSNNLPSQNVGSTLTNQQQPVQQSPSQLAQMLSQQTQSLQASFQSSQQAFSQLQQQLQLMQPPNQTTPQNPQPLKQQQQLQWGGMVAQTGVNPTLGEATPAAIKCSWTEHMSPDGYKYYYNSTSGESKWEKPEELTLFEKQQQQQVQPQQPQQQQQQQVQLQQQKIIPVQQQPQQIQSQQPQTNNNNNINPQMQQMQQTVRNPQFQQQHHLQTQTLSQSYPQQFQQQQAVPHSSIYQVHGVSPAQQSNREMVYNNAQIPVAGGTGNIVKNPAAAQFQQQQGYQGTNQEWGWKNKPTGS